MVTDNIEAEFEAWLVEAQGFSREVFDSFDDTTREIFHQEFETGRERAAEWRAQAAPSRAVQQRDRRYAVAIRDGNELGLTFWVRRSARGDIYFLVPRTADMNPHASYHVDGRYHHKSYGVVTMKQQRQPLNVHFKGAEHVGVFGGHGAGPRIQDPGAFDDIFVVQSGVLAGRTGRVVVDLVEPGARPAQHHRELLNVIDQRIYEDAIPWIVLAVAE